MKRFFGQKVGENIVFEGGEALHIRQVLRMREGEAIIACINDENDYYCTLIDVGKTKAVAKIDEVKKCEALPKKNIVLFQSMPKRDYFESILPKAIELGVSKIVPFKSKFTVNHDFKRERTLTMVMTACKQCERSILPVVEDIVSFESMLKILCAFDMVIFANEHESKRFDFGGLEKYQSIAVIVGCEGGFSQEEAKAIIDAGAKSISLGKRILRNDTAAISLLALVSILSGN